MTYSADTIFTGTETFLSHAIQVEDGIIKDILPLSEVTESVTAHAAFITPCFIDLQVYGAGGRLFSQFPSAETLFLMETEFRKSGTVLFLPTIATNTKEVLYAGIDGLQEYKEQGGKAVPGLHLEGPWINPLKRGAHIEALIHNPTNEEIRELIQYSKGLISMITLAPEVCTAAQIQMLTDAGIVVSAGHSNATFAEANRGFENGITAVTHLFNAMSPLHHRNTGLPGAAFLHESAMGSIIADGIHTDYETLRIAKKMMGERLFLITDAVTETTAGPYPHKAAGDHYEAGGILSGSSITMIKAVKNCIAAGISVDESIKMASTYPAKVIGVETSFVRGSYFMGVSMDKNFDILQVL